MLQVYCWSACSLQHLVAAPPDSAPLCPLRPVTHDHVPCAQQLCWRLVVERRTCAVGFQGKACMSLQAIASLSAISTGAARRATEDALGVDADGVPL